MGVRIGVAVLASSVLLALGAHGVLATSANPFTQSQLKQLKAWSITPVAPSYVPAGYKGQVKLDAAARKYEITYHGPSGAYFVFEGAAAGHSPTPTPAPKHHNNFFSSLFGHHETPSSGVAGEEEADPNEDVAADSALIGTTHFKETQSHCATGVAEKNLGITTYSLTGCNTSADDLVRVYRSATTITSH